MIKPSHSRIACTSAELFASRSLKSGVYMGSSSSDPEIERIRAPLTRALSRATDIALSDDEPERGVPPIPTMNGRKPPSLESGAVI